MVTLKEKKRQPNKNPLRINLSEFLFILLAHMNQ